MTIPVENKRYKVISDLGFLNGKKVYAKLVEYWGEPNYARTAVKRPRESHWEWAKEDPLFKP